MGAHALSGVGRSAFDSGKWKGAAEENLEEFLQKIGVQYQAYYSGAFVGNHDHLLIKNLEGLEATVEGVYKGNAGRRGSARMLLAQHLPARREIAKVCKLAKPAEG